jgi:citrate/tricarballylate utilization protein
VLSDNLLGQGQHVMTVCNACRYCEGYCPVFPAIENRLAFSKGDLTYLANLCHNCGECLYACQYAPPHEFGINVPMTLAQIRGASYEEYCWPRFLSVAFTRQPLLTMAGIPFGFIAVVLTARPLETPSAGGDFYRVIPHHVMVALFAAVSVLVVTALVVGCRRFWRDVEAGRASVFGRRPIGKTTLHGLRDALTLRHLHGGGVDCADALETRTPWRRWCHHATFYGFVLCFASTSVAAFYHFVFGWRAPYPYTSLPVVLGTLGGLGLVVGPTGLLALGRTRDEALADPTHRGLDTSLAVLLMLTSLTGLLLLVLRDGPTMPTLLIVHLSFVLALLLTLPYGKFVHGIYRTAALIKFAVERAQTREVS